MFILEENYTAGAALLAFFILTSILRQILEPKIVSDTVKIVPSTLQFPNIVTPNNDNYNDRFTIGNLLEYNRYPYNKLTIYDRWGHTVYEVNNISQEEHFWDPNSTNAPDGTYYYRFVGQGSDGSVQHNGVIEVLRTP